jgi:UDP-N-acetylglucosamine 3-dehydrogenase
MIKIGLVGAGFMGQTHHKAYRQFEGAAVTAVCDLDAEKAMKLAGDWNAEIFTSLETMLEQSDIDAVDVCLPTDLHRWAVERAAAHGKHVFCEKPIAASEEDAEAMIQACRAAEVIFMVGHVVRFDPQYRAARQQLLAGRLGTPGVVRTVRSGAFPAWSPWFADYARSGGPLIDLAIHDFDFLHWCFGPVRRVFSRQVTREQFDHTLTLLRFESGVMAHVEASWAYPQGAPFQTSIEIAGTKGLVQFDRGAAATIVQFGGAKGVAAESPTFKSPYALELEHFVECIRNGAVPLTSGEEALEALRIGLAAAASALRQKPVEMGAGR